MIARAIIIGLLTMAVLFEAFQSVAIVEHRARLDILEEEEPEITYPDIAIDLTVPESPRIFIKHKTSLKYKTRWIYAAHNQ